MWTSFGLPIWQSILYARVEMDKLTEIMAWKRHEIVTRVREVPAKELEALAVGIPARPSFIDALKGKDRLSIVAEMKRRSPSAGAIAENASAVEQAEAYARAGADAVSVLTDQRYFGGTLADLNDVTTRFSDQGLRVPCLRKDFMVHPVQIVEAAAAGASAILIIVRALTDDEISVLFEAATLAGLDALFEVHDEHQTERAVEAGAKIIGVNNRDLAVFKTDLAISERLLPLFPDDVVSISESGIRTAEDAALVRAAGADAILVGEALMRAADGPASLIAAFHKA
jgi:indole-3-glycerol phosphate synthase